MGIHIQERDRVCWPSVTEAVGIDFGTTFCCLAFCPRAGCPEVVGDLIPSVVSYEGDKVIVGGSDSGHRGVTSVKRWLTSEQAFTSKEGAPWHGRSPFQVAVDLFHGLGQHLTKHLGRWVKEAVVTVPAYFDESRRQIIKKAAEEAGFRVLRLLSEPTAAALCYGFAEEGMYAVYDLGGGTFDFSVLVMGQGLYRVLAIGGDPDLGGDDLDEALAEALFPNDSQGKQKARILKEHPTPAILTLVKEKTESLLARTITIGEKTLRDAGADPSALKALLLVGGSTKSYWVREFVKNAFGSAHTGIDPDKAVALGAALQGYNLTHESSFLLLDVTPLSLGIETLGGLVEPLIPRNTPIPAQREMLFTTAQDGQRSMIIHVVQGEGTWVKDCQSLGVFHLDSLPPMPKGRLPISVSFALDENGLLQVLACNKETGCEKSLALNVAKNLSYEQIVQSVAHGEKHAEEDLWERIWLEKVTQAQDGLAEVRRVMDPSDALLTQACADLEAACQSQDLGILLSQWDSFLALALPCLEQVLTGVLRETLEGGSKPRHEGG